MITLTEAADAIDLLAVYRPPNIPATEAGEEGVITSVNSSYVFIRFGNSTGSRACPPACVTLVSQQPRVTRRERSVREELAEVTHLVCPADGAGRTHHLSAAGPDRENPRLMCCIYCKKTSREILDEHTRKVHANG